MLKRFLILHTIWASQITYTSGGEPAVVIPVPPDAQAVCRWCYKSPPASGYETCLQVACISHWDAVRSLDTITWRGE